MNFYLACLLAALAATPAWARHGTECQLTHNCPGGAMPEDAPSLPLGASGAGAVAVETRKEAPPQVKCTPDSEYGGVTCE